MNEKITKYVASKKWFWYIPLLVLAVYIFIASLGFNPNHQNSFVVQMLYMVQFGVHEIAHLATAFLPSIITASSGSMSELLLTGTFTGLAVYSRHYFAAVMSSVWLMLAFQSVGVYMADARARQLQLISAGGDTAIHDWNFVFTQLGLLQADTTIGGVMSAIGICIGAIGIIFGIYLIAKMAAYKAPVVEQLAPAFRTPSTIDPVDLIAKAREEELNNVDPQKKNTSQ